MFLVCDATAGKGSEIGDYLIMHPGVNAISFTGGDTGISICRKAGMVPIQASRPARCLVLCRSHCAKPHAGDGPMQACQRFTRRMRSSVVAVHATGVLPCILWL